MIDDPTGRPDGPRVHRDQELKLLSKHEGDRSKQPAKLNNPMGLGRLGQTLTAKEIFDLVKKDLERVEREISLESVASVDAVTTISRYLQDGGGKRLRPILVLLASQ